jgi:hypothetical protein
MSSRPSDPAAERLQPAGRRWGFGAHSVMQYLVHSAPSNAGSAVDDAGIRNPVFPHMDQALRRLQRSH